MYIPQFFQKYSRLGASGLYWDDQEFTAMITEIGCVPEVGAILIEPPTNYSEV